MSGVEDYGVATFHSTHAVMKAEKILKGIGLEKVRLVPVPSQISSDCGVTVRFLFSDLDQAHEALLSLEEDLEGVYAFQEGRWQTIREYP